MAITLRQTKGTALTYSEMDTNFSELDARSAQSVTDISGLTTRVDTLETEMDNAETRLDALESASGASAATTTAAGVVELATNAETTAGTDDERAVTPAGLAAALAGVGSGGGSGTGIAGTAASNFVVHIDTSGVGTAPFTFPGTTDDVYMILYGRAQGGLSSAPATVQDDSYLFTGTIKGSQTIIGSDATQFEILAVKLA